MRYWLCVTEEFRKGNPLLRVINGLFIHPGSRKRHIRKALIILSALSVILSAGPLQAKPAPPRQLITIFDDFTELEENFRSGRWNKALESTDKILWTFTLVQPQLEENIKADIAPYFDSTLDGLRQAIMKKDVQETMARYVEMQEFFFVIMDNFDYKVPPILSIVDKYISEAGEALRHKDFSRVASEMQEVGDFFYRVEPLLREKGARFKDVEEFKGAVRQVRAAGDRRSEKTARAGIKALKKLSAKFLRLF